MQQRQGPAFHVLRHPDKLAFWRWELRAGNGAVMVASPAHYVSKQAVMNSISLVRRMVDVAPVDMTAA